jgi:hypothetical protein
VFGVTDFSMCNPEASIGSVFHFLDNPPDEQWGVLVAVHREDMLEMEFEWLDHCPEGVDVIELHTL